MSMIPVLDKGYVRLLDRMGDDLTVVNAARASFDAESQWETWHPGPIQLKKSDQKLLNFCAREGHWSPFSHPQVHLEFKLPGMVLDQLVKHRIGISYSDDEAFQAYQNEGVNQKSMRYKEPVDFYIPDIWRSYPENMKQGSGGPVDETTAAQNTTQLRLDIDAALGSYRTALHQGIAPEQARLFLPYYAMYTNRRWTSSLYGIINLLKLRLPEDAQYEIREYANAVRTLVEPLFPYTFRAFGITDGEHNSSDNHTD